MSDEVICLSSELSSSDESESASRKSSKKKAAEDEKSPQKRKWSDICSNDSPKKQKIETKKSSLSKAGCSKDFDGARLKKKVIKPQLIVMTKIPIPDENEDVFENFMKTCLEKRDDEDTRKVLQKLEKSYLKLSSYVKNNDEFRLFISSCHEKITSGMSSDIYTPILDLYSEIKNRIQTKLVDQTAVSTQEVEEIQVSKEDMKKIKLLEKSIKACLKKIKELEEKEVDFDEDNDSAYIQEDKYKKRLIQLCSSLTKISGDKVLRKQILKRKIKRKDIPDEMTGISSVDEAILSFINSGIGKINQLKYLETHCCADHVKMPEYLDILKCVQKCNEDSSLDLSKEKMAILSKKAFQVVGNFLKKKRMDETKFYIQSLTDDGNEDPATKDAALSRQLQENRKEGDKKLEEIFKKYVDKQEGLCREDLEKQAAGSSEDDSEIDSESEDVNEKLSSEEESSEINGENGKLESSSVEKTSINKSEHKIETESRLHTNDEIGKKTIVASKTDSIDENNMIDTKYDESINSNGSRDKKVADGIGKSTANKTHTNLDKTAQVSLDEDDDVLVVDNNDNLDTSIAAQDPLDALSSEMESNEIVKLDIKGSQNKTCFQIKAASSNITSEKLHDVAEEHDSSHAKTFIKVRAFAKPPPAWGDSSPEKIKRTCKLPTVQQALRDLPKPECIDLTNERDKRLDTTSTRSINPLANVTRTQPAKRVVIVKNVINNYNVPLSVDRVRSPKTARRVVIPSAGRSIVLPRNSSISSQNVTSIRDDDGGKITVKSP